METDAVTVLSERLCQLHAASQSLLSLGDRTYSFLEDESESVIKLSLSPHRTRLEKGGDFSGRYETERGAGLVRPVQLRRGF